jgi:hypothetical protein
MPVLAVQCSHCIIVDSVQYYLNDYSCVSTCPDGRYKAFTAG